MKYWFIFVYGQTYEILDYFFLLKRALRNIGLLLAKASLMKYWFVRVWVIMCEKGKGVNIRGVLIINSFCMFPESRNLNKESHLESR